jgi:hypothetical protein
MEIQELVKNHSAQLIEKIITEVLSKSHVEIKFDFFEQDQWAAVTINQYEEDKEFSVRYHLNETFDLVVGYYDDEDEFFEINHTLTQDEIDSLPEGLKKVMKKVVNDEEGLRVASSLVTAQRK